MRRDRSVADHAALHHVWPVDSERRKWVLILGTLTGLGPLAIDAYLPSLPTIERDLATDTGSVQLTLAAYFLGLAGGQLFWGPVADRRGRRKPLLVGLALYGVGSLLCALAPSIEMLIAARAVQALGGAAGVVVVRAVIRDRWAGREGAKMMSAIVLVMGVAPVLAPSLGGALLAIGSWRMIFVLLTIATAIVFVVVHRHLPETGQPTPREPLVRGARRVLRDRRFVAYTLATSFSMAGMFAYIAGSPFVFIEMLGLDPSTFAIIFGVNAAGFVAAAQLNGRILGAFDHTRVALIATTASTIVGAMLLWVATEGTLTLITACALVLAYVATLGFIVANATAAALENQPRRAGLASALLGATQFGVASGTSATVSALADDTARPMAIVMVGCAAIALGFFLVGRTTVVTAPEPRAA